MEGHSKRENEKRTIKDDERVGDIDLIFLELNGFLTDTAQCRALVHCHSPRSRDNRQVNNKIKFIVLDKFTNFIDS